MLGNLTALLTENRFCTKRIRGKLVNVAVDRGTKYYRGEYAIFWSILGDDKKVYRAANLFRSYYRYGFVFPDIMHDYELSVGDSVEASLSRFSSIKEDGIKWNRVYDIRKLQHGNSD